MTDADIEGLLNDDDTAGASEEIFDFSDEAIDSQFLIDEGIYELRVDNAKVERNKKNDGWNFVTDLSVLGQNKKKTVWKSLKAGAMFYTRDWLEALTGEQIREKLDLDAMREIANDVRGNFIKAKVIQVPRNDDPEKLTNDFEDVQYLEPHEVTAFDDDVPF